MTVKLKNKTFIGIEIKPTFHTQKIVLLQGNKRISVCAYGKLLLKLNSSGLFFVLSLIGHC